MPTRLPLVKILCAYCGKSKEVHGWQIRQGNARFCSKRCGYDSHLTKVEKICLTCSEKFKVKKNRDNSAKYCSMKCYDKFSENNPFYNRNHTEANRKLMSAIKQRISMDEWEEFSVAERRRLMSTAQYRRWREAVFARDSYKCVWCGKKGAIEADHIKPWAFYPELRFDLNNGRTLCNPCHRTTPTYLNPQGRNQYVR